MLNYSAIIILIVLNAFVVLANPSSSNKSKKNKDTAVSYTIMTKHEHKVQPSDHEDYQEYTAPHGQKHKHKEKHTTMTSDDHKGPAKYNFSYGVRDPMTGDIKKQWESRDGDKVEGGYSVKEADGSTRVVHYTADKDKGFEATVKKIVKSKKQKHKTTMEDSKLKKANVDSLMTYDGHKRGIMK